MSGVRRRACGLAIVVLATTASARAQPLSELSLDELMRMDAGRVYGASERLQPVVEAPASVSFITAQEIKQHGYRTLADVLRAVRGLYVTNDRNYSYLGTRGFGKPGDYNSRILLLINGHRVNDNIYGQAEIGAEFGLDPAMFERVEIIRGPASAIYGDSAFFAVVNVITRSGASLGGASVAMETGMLGTRMLRGAVGGRLANGVDLALSGTYERSDGVARLYFPAFDTPATNNGVAEGLDGEGVGQFYGRLSFKDVAVTAAYGSRQREIPTASLDTVFNHQIWPAETTDRHTLVDAVYKRLFHDARLTIRGAYDRYSYGATYPFAFAPDGVSPRVGRARGLGARWTLTGSVSRPVPGRQTVSAGVQYTDNQHQDQYAAYLGDPVPFLDIDRSSTRYALYAQDEIKLGRRVIVNAGVRFDRYEEFSSVTPRAALIVLPSSTQSFKYLYGSAFRAPNEFELNTAYFGETVNALRPESVDTHEFVWERYANDRLRTSVSTYWYKADRLVTPRLDDSALLGVTYVNQGQVRAKGLELEAQVRLRGEARGLVSYAFQRAVDQQTRDELPNSPHHLAKGRISVPGPVPQSTISVETQYLSSRQTLLGSRVGAAATVDVHVVLPLGRAWEVVGGIRNLFDAEYSDPVSGQHRQDAIAQNGRTARIGLHWKLWTQ